MIRVCCTLLHALVFYGNATVIRAAACTNSGCVRGVPLECEIDERRELIMPIRPRLASHVHIYIYRNQCDCIVGMIQLRTTFLSREENLSKKVADHFRRISSDYNENSILEMFFI